MIGNESLVLQAFPYINTDLKQLSYANVCGIVEVIGLKLPTCSNIIL